MNIWSMWVDTTRGFIKLVCRADTKEDAAKRFREQTKSQMFRRKYGNLYDFKVLTIM